MAYLDFYSRKIGIAPSSLSGGTGCIFGQYAGGDYTQDGIGYGDGSSAKYRCATIFVVRGNLVISDNINSQCGDAPVRVGGFDGGGVVVLQYSFIILDHIQIMEL